MRTAILSSVIGTFWPMGCWNQFGIGCVHPPGQITVAEEVGVEHRGCYYYRAAAVRDMNQNILLTNPVGGEQDSAPGKQALRSLKLELILALPLDKCGWVRVSVD